MPSSRLRWLDALLNRLPALVLITSPTWIGFLAGSWLLLRHPAVDDLEVRRDAVDLVVMTLFGATVSAVLWAIDRHLENRRTSSLAKQYEVVREAMGLIPSTETLRGLIGDQPTIFLNYLASERERQEKGLYSLRHNQKWPLTTPRAYETIIDFLQQADDFVIVDQDIRRWFEILESPEEGQSAETSTTFNYSQYILDITSKRLAVDRSLTAYRRVFMVNDHVLDCLREEDAAREWHLLPAATRVLLKIWEFERRLFAAARTPAERMGSRVILVRRHPTSPTLHDKVHRFKDIVVIDGQVCLQEDLLYEMQGSPKTSFLTESWLISGGDFVKGSRDYFESLWSRAKGAHDFPHYRELLDKVPSPLLVD